MRYFFASYIANNTNTQHPSYGNVRLSTEGYFPSNTHLKNEITNINSDTALSNIVILSLFEFKSKKDFDSFRS